jgi:hypothetical protein
MVTRVWGKADSFELVFSPSGSSLEHWTAIVPIDLQDGQYAVELYCEDDKGNRAYWTGMLYLSNSGNVSIRIVADKFKIWFEVDDMKVHIEPDIELEAAPDIELAVADDPQIWLEDERIKITCSVSRG